MIKKIQFVDQRYKYFLVHKYGKGRESYRENEFLKLKIKVEKLFKLSSLF